MALKLKWNKRAERNFENILVYLNKEFGEKTTRVFVRKVFTIVENLQEYPELGSMENEQKAIRGFLITKHNRLFYRVTKDELILLSFFDTRQNPKKRNKGFEKG